MKKLVVMLSAVMLMAAPALGLAASMAGSNTVSSAAIVDGSVATADIANKAVTAAKIADSTITTNQLANGAVTAAKLGITCPSGQYLQYNGNTWVCSVGTAGPQGPQGVAGPQGPVGLTAKYANVIVVAKSGGDFTDPVAAVASITNASATNRYLVRIQPGVYDLGHAAIVMKSWVDIEGAGENSTVLTGYGAQAGQFYTLVGSASNSTLRALTLQGTGAVETQGNTFFYMINNFALSGTQTGPSNLDRVTLVCIGNGVNDISAAAYGGLMEDVLVRDVTVRLSGSSNGSTALSLQGNADGPKATATVRGLDARVTGGQAAHGLSVGANIRVDISDSRINVADASVINVGIFTTAAEARITNVTAETQGAGGQALHAYGESNYSWNPTTVVDRSTLISGSSPYGALRNTNQRVYAAMTKVDGPIMNTGVTRCVGLYNADYQPISCP